MKKVNKVSKFSFLLVLLFLIGCQFLYPSKPVKVSSEIKEGLILEVSLAKVNYKIGEKVEVSLFILNTTPERLSFSTKTSQLFDLTIRGEGFPEFRWSDDKVFLQVITPRILKAKGVIKETLSWEVKARGEIFIIGRTVPLMLDTKEISLEAPPLKIFVE